MFCLFPYGAETFSTGNNEHKQANIQRQIEKRLRCPPTDHYSGGRCGGVLATLALGRHYQNEISSVVLWVHSETFSLSLRRSSAHDSYIPMQWVGYAVENIVTQQRIASVCYDTPRFKFLNKFLGQKTPLHILYDSDGDEIEEEQDSQLNEIEKDLFLNESSQSPEAHLENSFSFDISSLNQSQRDSLMSTVKAIDVGTSLQLVQGPPGCGKLISLKTF